MNQSNAYWETWNIMVFGMQYPLNLNQSNFRWFTSGNIFSLLNQLFFTEVLSEVSLIQIAKRGYCESFKCILGNLEYYGIWYTILSKFESVKFSLNDQWKIFFIIKSIIFHWLLPWKLIYSPVKKYFSMFNQYCLGNQE